MPDKFGFDHYPNWGQISVQCIEIGCKVGGHLSQWPEEKRKIHFLTHVVSANPAFAGATRKDNCRTCGSEFEQEIKRGRPRVQCYACKP